MDQLIFASLSHTHYWYEVGMLKVPVSSPNAMLLRPAHSLIRFVQRVFKRQKEQGQKCRLDDVPYVLARRTRINLQYQAAAGIGARGVGNMVVRGKCMERAMQMLCGKEQEGIPRAVVEALLRF